MMEEGCRPVREASGFRLRPEMTGEVGLGKSPETTHLGEESVGRGGRVRTGDLVVPNHARYRCATPR